MSVLPPLLLLASLLAIAETTLAQRYRVATSQVSFFSEAPMEDIEAHTQQATGLFDAASSEIAFVVPIRSFQFEKSLMQEHFNENYLESEKYPNATFEGKLDGFQAESKGKQTVTARGKFTIHGVTRDVEIPGEVFRDKDTWQMKAMFPVKLEEYKIRIPKVVFYNIAETVEVNVQFTYQLDEI